MKHKADPLEAILSDPIKRRGWVKFQLHMAGTSMAAIAAGLGVSRNCMYRAFQRPYPRMERELAAAVSLTPQQLFPERYDALGVPNRPIGRPRKSLTKDTTKRDKRQVNRATNA